MARSRRNSGSVVILVSPHRWQPKCAPYALEHLAHHLDLAGFRPIIVDFNFGRAPRAEVRRLLRTRRPILCGVTIRNFDAAFLTETPVFFLPAVRHLVRDIRAWGGPPVVVGGVAYSAAPREILDFVGADFGVAGTDEDSLVALARGLESGSLDAGAVPSLVWRDGSAVRVNLPEGSTQPLPPVRRGFLDHSLYYRAGLNHHYSWGSVETARGCTKGCVYCIEPTAKGRVWRRKPPAAVIEEVGELVSKGIRWVWFTDSEFNLEIDPAKELCRALAARFGQTISWGAYFLPAPFDQELGELLAASGCRAAGFDVGHAQDDMLRRLGKDFDFAAIEQTARFARKAGLNVKYSVLLGGPGETEGTVRTAIRRLAGLGGMVEVGVGLRIYPGAPFARTAQNFRPFDRHPDLYGRVARNEDLLEPIFYVAPDVARRLPGLIAELTGGAGCFLVPRLFRLTGERYGDWRGIRPGYSRRRSNDLLLQKDGERTEHSSAGYLAS